MIKRKDTKETDALPRVRGLQDFHEYVRVADRAATIKAELSDLQTQRADLTAQLKQLGSSQQSAEASAAAAYLKGNTATLTAQSARQTELQAAIEHCNSEIRIRQIAADKIAEQLGSIEHRCKEKIHSDVKALRAAINKQISERFGLFREALRAERRYLREYRPYMDVNDRAVSFPGTWAQGICVGTIVPAHSSEKPEKLFDYTRAPTPQAAEYPPQSRTVYNLITGKTRRS